MIPDADRPLKHLSVEQLKALEALLKSLAIEGMEPTTKIDLGAIAAEIETLTPAQLRALAQANPQSTADLYDPRTLLLEGKIRARVFELVCLLQVCETREEALAQARRELTFDLEDNEDDGPRGRWDWEEDDEDDEEDEDWDEEE